MDNQRITVEQLSDAIMTCLNDYVGVTDEACDKGVSETAKTALQELRSAHPAGSGEYGSWNKYNRGWKSHNSQCDGLQAYSSVGKRSCKSKRWKDKSIPAYSSGSSKSGRRIAQQYQKAVIKGKNMDRIVEIDGKKIKFRATARTPRLYRALVGRDMIRDMNKLKKAYDRSQAEEENLDIVDLQIFEDVAYIMARHADPDMEAKTADDWLDEFNMFSVYVVLPQILELWALNTVQTSQAKKK